MAILDFTQFTVYRWRYVIGYGLVGLLLVGMLVFSAILVPSGLSTYEIDSVVRSEALSFSDPTSWVITNLPFYALQAIGFSLFGVTTFTIKLPSLILALLSAVGLILLLRRWFRPNIAVLASLIAVTTGQFLFVAQQGSPSILYIFWPVMLLLLGTQITRGKRFRFLWKVLFAVSAALSLYTPLSIYPLIAVALAVGLHPHLRNAVRRLSKPRIILVSLIAIALVTPLIRNIIVDPSLGLTLLGIPSEWPPDIAANAVTVLKQFFLFWEPSATAVMTPVFGLGSAIIIGLGVYRLIRTRETTRSYLILIWILCLLPVLLLNPSFTTVTFVPSVLLLAAGIMSLISYWYRLFPRNPYARIAGLLPLVVLIAALIGSGLARYGYGYHYSPTTAPLFSKDLSLLPKEARQLVVTEDEAPFYRALSAYRQSLEVTLAPSADSFIATRAANAHFSGYTVTEIITSPRYNESDRFYLYQKAPSTPQ